MNDWRNPATEILDEAMRRFRIDPKKHRKALLDAIDAFDLYESARAGVGEFSMWNGLVHLNAAKRALGLPADVYP